MILWGNGGDRLKLLMFNFFSHAETQRRRERHKERLSVIIDKNRVIEITSYDW